MLINFPNPTYDIGIERMHIIIASMLYCLLFFAFSKTANPADICDVNIATIIAIL